MQPTQELIDELYMDKVRQAQMMSDEQKLLAGAELFDYACAIAMSGIRHDHPEADERRVLELLRERIALGERLERIRMGLGT